ncbi:MAG: toll/interleukin-1 receptor domain-containing protein [Egibacteraceae bacterium]
MSEVPAHRVFIAYAGPDREHATQLFDHLDPTLPTFLDCRCLLPEDDFDIALHRTQSACLVTVALISANTPESFYQRAELTHAIELERSSQASRHRVIPVWVDDIPVAQRPFQLMNRQGIHLYDKMTWADAADAVIDVVKRMLQAAVERNRLDEIELGPIRYRAFAALDLSKEAWQTGRIDSDLRTDFNRRILDEVLRRIFER